LRAVYNNDDVPNPRLARRLTMVRHTQLFFTAIQDEWNNQILFVVEVAHKPVH